MANEIFKELKTRIALKYNTYEYWTTGEGKDYAPLKGEVCFCAIESKEQGAQTAPTVLFKVGVDGQTKFSALKWASALAADVYDWAKVAGINVFTKDGTGNVVSGIEYDATLNSGKGGFKFTTASVATAEGLKDLQDAVAAIEKDITDNRDAWILDTDTRYSFSTDGDKLVVKKTLYTNGVAGAEEAVGTYEFLTATEVAETLEGYYTKDEADAKYVTGLAEGATNGTIKAVVNGVSGADVKVHGLQDAAYVTVESLNATAKGYADAVEAKLPTSANYGVLSVTAGDDTITIGGTEQNPTVAVTANKFDAYGAAAQALADAKDYADKKPHENTAHTHVSGSGIKVDNAGGISGEVKADLNVAFELVDKIIKLYDKDDATKTAIATLDATEFIADGMLASVTADQTNNKLVFEWNTDAGATKTEIPLSSIADIYTGSTGTEVSVAVSNQNVISASLNSEVATKITHGETAYNWGDHASAGYAANADLTKVIDGTTPVAKATDSDKLDGHDSTYFATTTSVTDITKDNGTIDAKISAYNTSKNFGDIITHNVSEFATSEQGDNADSAIQSVNILGYTLTKDSNEITAEDAKTALGLGSAAYKEEGSFQTHHTNLDALSNSWAVDATTLKNLNATISAKEFVSAKQQDDYETSITYGEKISYVTTNGNGTLSFPDILSGDHYFAVVDADGNLGNRNDTLPAGGYINSISVGHHDNGVDINSNGSVSLMQEVLDDELGFGIKSLTIGVDGFISHSYPAADHSCKVTLPHVSGELVVSGSTEIVYVLDCN